MKKKIKGNPFASPEPPRIQFVHRSGEKRRNLISTYMTCKRCWNEKPADQSAAEWARLNVGFTDKGLQIWCARHNCNVDDVEVRVKGR